VRFDEAKAKEVAAEEARQGAGAKSAGTAFLLRKKMEQEASRTLLARLRGEMDEVFSDLEAQAAEARRREPVSPSPLLLDGAFLVRFEQAAGFEKTVDRWAKRLSEQACEVTLTGPWPPYNFIGGEAS